MSTGESCSCCRGRALVGVFVMVGRCWDRGDPGGSPATDGTSATQSPFFYIWILFFFFCARMFEEKGKPTLRDRLRKPFLVFGQKQ